jgi:hypothetical protein
MLADLDPTCNEIVLYARLKSIELALENDWVILRPEIFKIVIQLLDTFLWLLNLHVFIISIELIFLRLHILLKVLDVNYVICSLEPNTHHLFSLIRWQLSIRH